MSPRLRRRQIASARRQSFRRLFAFEHLEDRRLLATLAWTGGAGNNLFSDAGNWNPTQAPTAADDVTISVAANPVIVSGNQSVNSLVSDEALVFSNGSSFTVAATADLNATANLNGAQLVGGVWDITGGELVFNNSANNRLTDVTLSGELRVVNNGYVELYGNTTFVSATIENTQNSNSFTRLYFEPGYVLNSDVTFIGTTTSNSNSAIGIDGTGTLTIAPGATITSSYPAAFVGVAGNTLVNQGTINTTSGRLSVNAASFTNEGTVNATSANVVVNSTSFTNDGDIQATGGTFQDSTATVWNDGPTGTISLDNSTLNLYGDIATSVFNFDVPGAFTRTNGGAINLRTNLDNAGDTLPLTATVGDWTLINGQITGGDVIQSGGQLIFSFVNFTSTNRLTNVALTGELRVVNNAYVELYGNTTFVSATLENNINSNSFSRLLFEPGWELDSDITFIGSRAGNGNSNSAIGIDGTGTFTINPGVTITSSDPGALVGVAGDTLVNQGTINATAGTLSINANSFTNEGIVDATSATFIVNSTSFTNDGDIQATGGTFQDSAATVWSDGPTGTISLDNSTLNLYGDIATAVFNFDVPGAFTRTNGGAINLRTNLDNAGDTLPLTVDVGDWTLINGQITGGDVIQSGGQLIFSFVNFTSTNRLTNVALTGELRVVNNAYVELYGNTTFVSATLENNINSNSFSRLLFEPGWELDSDITFIGSRAGNGNSNSAIGIDGTGTFTINPGVTITSSDPGALVGVAGDTLVNQGTINATAGTLSINANSFTNEGIVDATSATFIVNAASFTNDGDIQVSGGTLQDSAATVWNDGPTGTISLDNSTLNLYGDIATSVFNFDVPSAFTRTNGGAINLRTNLDNTGDTLPLTVDVGDWTLINGQITGGDVIQSGGQLIFSFVNFTSTNRLTNVALTGELRVVNNAYVELYGNTTFVSATLENNINSNSFSRLLFEPGWELDSDITFIGSRAGNGNSNSAIGIDGTGTFTINPGVTITSSDPGALVGFAGNTLINRGTIQTDGANITTLSLLNSGIIRANNGGVIDINGDLTIDSPGILRSQNGVIRVSGDLLGDTRNADLFVADGSLIFDGNSTAAQPQFIEVMGQDVAHSQTGVTQSFRYDRLNINSNTYVQLTDTTDNAIGTEDEALYVNFLNVANNATLDLNGLNVYARAIVNNGTIIGGAPSQVPDSGVIAINQDVPGNISTAGELDEWQFFGRRAIPIGIVVNPRFGTAASHVDWVNVQLLDANDNLIASGQSSVAGGLVTLSPIDLPTDGDYRIQLRAASGHAANTGAYLIGFHEATTDENRLQLNQTSRGSIGSRFNIDQWEFVAAAGDQVAFDHLASNGSAIGFDLNGPNEWSGFTGITNDSPLITLPESGNYILTARGLNAQWGGEYAFKLNQTPQQDLMFGEDVIGEFSGGGQAMLYRLDVDTATPVSIFLDDSSTTSSNELYLKRGTPPTRSDFDFSAVASSADQRITIGNLPTGTWFVLAYRSASTQASSFTLRADPFDVLVTDVTPSQHGNAKDAQLTITGLGFETDTTLEFVAIDTTIYAASTAERDSFEQFTVTVPAGSLPIGTYSVRATLPSGSTSVLASSFEVTEGGEAILETNLLLPGAVGRHAIANIFVEYSNTGTIAMPAPLLVLRGTDNALLTLDQSRLVAGFWTSARPAGFDDTIQFLASGEIPGLLLPGESVSVPVYYAGLLQPWDFSDTSVDFNLEILTVEDTRPINWQELPQPSWINDDAWDVVAVNLEQQVGETWGDYIRVLSENASYLGRIGHVVSDVADLWNFEIQQAIGLTPIQTIASVTDITIDAPGLPLSFNRAFSSSVIGRNEAGVLGYGWYWLNGWESRLTVQSDGAVTLSGFDGTMRQFEPDSRRVGSYFSKLGDNVKLTAASDGTFDFVQPDGLRVHYRVDGRIGFIQDTNANRVSATWSGDQLVLISHSAGQFLQIGYNSAGRVVGLLGSGGKSVAFNYDVANEHLISATATSGHTTSYIYSKEDAARYHALIEIQHPDNTHEYFGYESSGRLSSTSRDGDAERLDFTYNSTGRVTVANSLGESVQRSFDHHGNLATRRDSLGNLLSFKLNEANRVSQVTDPTGFVYSFDYDQRGNLVESVDPLGAVTQFRYTTDLNRLSEVIDANGNPLAYSYDTAGNLTKITYANNTSDQYTFVDGILGSYQNRRGQIVEFDFDVSGRLTSEYLPDGNYRQLIYDERGNLANVTTQDGATIIDYLDPLNPDLPTTITYPTGRSLSYFYQNGRRTSLVYPDGLTVNYFYDAVGRLESLRDQNDVIIANYEYDVAGRLVRQMKGNGTRTEFTLDANGQTLELLNFAPDGLVNSQYLYVYDELGRRISMTTDDGIWEYAYDVSGQLTHAAFDADDLSTLSDQDLTYVYDLVGNRIRTVINGETTEYTTNQLNQYTQVGSVQFAYDLDGNLVARTDGSETESFGYDALNRLVAGASPANVLQYEYDGFGNRSSKIENTTRTDFLVDPFALNDVVAVYGETGLETHYIHALSNLISRRDFDGTTGYYDFDALGSTVGVSNANGSYVNQYSYLPFGGDHSSSETIPNAFEFIGAQGVMQEVHGLDYMRARFYASSEGRFVNPDPIGINGGNLNFMTYVGNDPVGLSDPLGLWEMHAFTCAGSVIEAAASLGELSSTPFPLLTAFGAGYSAGTAIWDCIPDPPPKQCSVWVPPVTYGFPIFATPTSYPGYWQDIDCPPDPPKPPNPPPSPPGGGGGGDTVGSFDPNEKTSTGGFGPEGFVAIDSVIPYRIDFENFEDATAPAQRVVVTDQLDERFDFRTLQFTQAGFGDERISIPAGQQYFQTTVPFPVENGARPFDVDIEIDFNPETGLIRAVFQSIDPQTSLPPDVLTGFLPPEDGTGRGQGFFSFTIETDEGLQSGEEIRNVAVIVFDINEPITTNQIDPHDPSEGTDPDKEARITIDAGRPQSTVEDLIPESETLAFPVTWQGQDDANGSGVSFYDIYVSTNNGPFELWLDNTTETSAVFTGMDLTRYGFYSVATDNVRQREDSERIEQAFTLIDLPKPPVADAGGDYEATEGGTILFDATGSTDPNNDISIYEWDLNYDGVSFDVDSTGVQPLVLFDDDIIDRTIAVRVTDLKGLSDIATSRLNVLNVVPEFSSGTENESLGFTAAGLFERTVSFTDPGDDAPWSGTVDYGDGTSEPLVIDQLGKVFELSHTYTANGDYTVELVLDDGDGVLATASFVVSVALPVKLAGSNVFYFKSTFAGGASGALSAANVAASTSDKVPLLPGATATSANYTNYSRGLNGILIDLKNLPSGTLEDVAFEFHVGNDNFPSTWPSLSTAPTITPVPGNGTTPDRLLLTWDDNVVQNTWLQVTILANPAIGLLEPIVQYWGNAIGDTFNDVNATPPSTRAFVNAADVTLVRANPRNFLNPAPVNFAMDVNKDRFVNSADVTAIRSNPTNFLNALRMITPETSGGAMGSFAPPPSTPPTLTPPKRLITPAVTLPSAGENTARRIAFGVASDRDNSLFEAARKEIVSIRVRRPVLAPAPVRQLAPSRPSDPSNRQPSSSPISNQLDGRQRFDQALLELLSELRTPRSSN